jgi:hypothetical protein
MRGDTLLFAFIFMAELGGDAIEPLGRCQSGNQLHLGHFRVASSICASGGPLAQDRPGALGRDAAYETQTLQLGPKTIVQSSDWTKR